MVLLALVLVLAACSGKSEEVPVQTTKEAVAETTTEKETVEMTTMFEFPDEEETETEKETLPAVLSLTEGIDVDLTILSSTMVLSQVNDMMVYPENYKGKVVKMAGYFTYYHDDQTGKDYYACIIQDALACCSSGIEFIPLEEFDYPNAMPEEGDDVVVIGTFDTYLEDGFQFATLREAEVQA